MSVKDWLYEKLNIDRGTAAVEVGEKIATVPFYEESTDRESRDRTIDNMDSNDPIINAALSAIAEDTCYFSNPDLPAGFYIRSDSNRVKDTLDDLIDRTDLHDKAFDILRSTVKYANVFIEVVYNKEGNRIERLKQFPHPYWIKRNEDEFGNLRRGDAATARDRQESGLAPFDQYKDGKYITSFDANQICHIRHDAVEGQAYGYPRLASAISTWKTYRAVRDSLALKSSMSGAYTRIHKIPMPWGLSEEDQVTEIKKYRNNYGTRTTAKIDSAGDVSIDRVPKIPLDVYVPTKYRTGGEPIGPEIDLLKYPEYEHDFEQIDIWINMIVTCLRIPPAYIYWRLYQGGSERSTNVEKIDQQFSRTLRRLQNDFESSLRSIFDRQLILAGIHGDYEIVTPNVYPQGAQNNAKLTQVQAQAISMAIDAGVEPEWWISRVLGIPQDEIPMVKEPNPNRDTSPSRERGRPRSEED